jgi:hypothetical protein
MKRAKPPEVPEITDEPGMAERFQHLGTAVALLLYFWRD